MQSLGGEAEREGEIRGERGSMRVWMSVIVLCVGVHVLYILLLVHQLHSLIAMPVSCFMPIYCSTDGRKTAIQQLNGLISQSVLNVSRLQH